MSCLSSEKDSILRVDGVLCFSKEADDCLLKDKLSCFSEKTDEEADCISNGIEGVEEREVGGDRYNDVCIGIGGLVDIT